MSENRKEQFKERFERYYPMLCKIAHGYIADIDDCEDIVQELFVSVWDKQKDSLPEGELLPYMKVAVRNNCLSFLNNQRTYEKVSTDDRTLELAADNSETTASKDYTQMLDTILQEMPPKCREVFTMSKLQKLKYKEIALHLNISEKTVESHMGKAIKIIRTYMAQHPTIMAVLILILIAANV
ncbi:RNA polymerase sigma-70 factor [Prevotella disiens FB035-09AN]|uniref:RNA polymerase sigma-70 factor n=1 Tax=Prevotella disiens FB035-09AN TaxID=866771 RepID=E1KTE0_9BACT|nr:RNA polymerase sigma-70 factor [Prevotella disiens]EFL45265.1 RNA polymerase sigma-70 factor [Prevotella disiens FB035-09AN]